MANPFYNMFTNMTMGRMMPPQQSQMVMKSQKNGGPNIYQQIQMIQKDPGSILDILLQLDKINQQEYTQLQPYKNNPQEIYNYLMNHGHSNELGAAQNVVGNFQQNISSSHGGIEDSTVN